MELAIAVVNAVMNCIHCLLIGDFGRGIECYLSTRIVTHENYFDEIMVENLLVVIRTEGENNRLVMD